MVVLIADAFPSSYQTALQDLGAAVVYEPKSSGTSLVECMERENPTILVVRSTAVDSEVLGASPALRVVIRAGAGYDTIDLPAASERAISVANCPGTNSIAVAELTWGLILSLDRRIPDNTANLRAGMWNKAEYARARGLYGRTLGVVGFGQIGRHVARRAHAFGMKVIAWSRSLTAERAAIEGVERCESPLELASRSDVVSVHVAATAQTANLADHAFFRAMKDGAFFINTSRASVVDEQALAATVHEKGIRVGVDVFQGEPSSKTGKVDSDLFALPGVYGTHHIGASTQQAQDAVAEMVVRIVARYIALGEVQNVVNHRSDSAPEHVIEVYHRNHVGVLAGVLSVIRDHQINVLGMHNTIFAGSEGACARIEVASPLPQGAIEEITHGSEAIFHTLQRSVQR